jgi:hypothetical protein
MDYFEEFEAFHRSPLVRMTYHFVNLVFYLFIFIFIFILFLVDLYLDVTCF